MEQRTEIKIRDAKGDRTYTLEAFRKDAIVIGRSQECDIVVENPKVSGHHGCFYKQNGNWYYQDLNSTNGSSINGNTIVTTILINGARLALDKKQWPDSCCIEIKFVNTDQYSQYQNNANMFSYANNPTIPYIQPQNNDYQYMGGNNYVPPNNRGYQQGGYSNPVMTNAWGYIAGVLWGVLGIIFIIDFIRSIKILGYMGEIFDADAGIGLILLAFYILYIMIGIGTIVLPIALFTYNKKSMSTGAGLIAGGYAGIFIALILLLAISLEDDFGELFNSSYSVMLMMAGVLYMAGLISLSNCFKKSYNRTFIYNSYATPIICIAIAWILIIVVYSSLAGLYSNILSSDFNLYSSLPIGSIWIAVMWFAAVIFSCVYLHVDEIMYPPSNMSGGANNGGRLMGLGYGSQNQYGNQQYGGGYNSNNSYYR